jgi:ABC-type sugar transport system substrate-binding protein
MLRMFTSKWEKSIMSWFGQILVLIVAVVFSSAVFAAPPDEKYVVAGYSGPDAPHMFTQLSEPKIKKGYKFTAGFLQVWGGGKTLMLIQKECERKIREYGGDFIAYDAMGDQQKQITQFNQLIAQKVDIIIAYPTLTGGLTQGYKMAKKAGIKVLNINVPSDSNHPLDPNVEAMVGMAFDLYGFDTVSKLKELHPDKKNVAFIGSAIPTDNLPIIVNSAKRYAEELGYNILGQVDAGWDAAAAGKAAQALMGKYRNIEVILTFNEYSALGAAAAMRAAGIKGILAGSPNGGDGAAYKAIKDGALAVQYLDPWVEVGEAAGIAAYKILTGQELPAKRMLFQGVVVTKENVERVRFVW